METFKLWALRGISISISIGISTGFWTKFMSANREGIYIISLWVHDYNEITAPKRSFKESFWGNFFVTQTK